MPELAGLYGVTPDEADPELLVRVVDAALTGGVRWIQYRNKTVGTQRAREQAAALLRLTRRHGAGLVINDSLDLALEIGAEGCHLGRDDGDITAARRALGPHRILGVSCYDSLERAAAAHRAGANYVAFGSVFASSTKPGAVCAPLTLFQDARSLGIDCTLVGIGGIDHNNIGSLLSAGAHAAAVIGALFASRDPDRVLESARRFSAVQRNRSSLASTSHDQPERHTV
jgi:thiamine-phosphate pyrophosphorylase